MQRTRSDEAFSPFVSLRQSQESTTARRRRSRAHRADGRFGRALTATGRLWQRAIVAAAAVVVLLAVALLSFRTSFADRVYPGIQVGGIAMGGLTEDEARAVVQARADELEQGLVTFTYEGTTWTPRLAELGVSVDVAGSVAAAIAVGRDSHALDRLLATGGLVRDDHAIPLSLNLDHAQLAAWFDRVDAALAGDLGLEPHDAYLVIEGTEIRIEPEIDGTIVDRLAATAQLEQALLNLRPLSGPLPVLAWVPRVHSADLASAQEQIERALAKSVKVKFEGDSWTIAPEDFGRFVVQETNPDPTLTGREAVVIRIDETALATWLNERFAEAVNRDPIDAEVAWDGKTVIAVSESSPGYRIRPKLFARELNARFFDDHATLEIPTNVVAPNVDSTNLAALGITSEIARADSNFEGSDAERETNIRVGSGLLNGTVVPPGGEFSFNHSIGEITEELGYVGAKVIDGERIGRDIGGGICQVSTTVFRAALLAGMPMTEWNPHRYRLEFYERDGWGPGYDASILQPEGDPFAPGNDFKFYNSTNGWLLVEAYTTDIRVVVVIYGTDMGNEVNVAKAVEEQKIPIDPPLEVIDDELEPGTVKLTELPQVGSVYLFVREVRDADGNLIESREFRSIYHSRGYVWRVSPDQAGQSPASTGEGLPPDAFPEDWPLD